MLNKYIYDIEIYKNLYLIILKNIDIGSYKYSILSPYHLSYNLFFSVFSDVSVLIGFNNLSFDHKVLKYSYQLYKKNPKLKVSQFVFKVFNYSQSLINTDSNLIDYNFSL